MEYALLTRETVPAYLQNRPEGTVPVDPQRLTVTEIGDGNLNLVFVCTDADGSSVVLKQSLPYVRVAPSWPMTPERSTHEFIGLSEAYAASPDTTPQLYWYDEPQHVVAMENLVGMTVWRTALNDGAIAAGAGELCGQHVAKLSFHTGMIGRETNAFRVSGAKATNSALCQISEDLIFTEPFVEHEHNVYRDDLRGLVRKIGSDPAIQTEVSRLKSEFMTRSEALLHGDLHTGSVMVRSTDLTSEVKIFDTEFGFYGPVAFDLGLLIANMLLAHRRAIVLGHNEQALWLQHQPMEIWEGFADTYRELWPHRVDTSFSERHLDLWLERVKRDAIGFAACEGIRRIVGFAKVSDIDTLVGTEHITAASSVLETCQRWLLDPDQPYDVLL